MVLANEIEEEKHLIVHDSLGLEHRRVSVGTVVELSTREENLVFALEGYSLKLFAGCCWW